MHNRRDALPLDGHPARYRFLGPLFGVFILSFALPLRGKSGTLFLELTWEVEGIWSVGVHRKRGKTVPVLP